MKRQYDLAFGLGQACGCSHSLRKAGLQYLSFPGDWTAPVWWDATHPKIEHDLRLRVDVLCGKDNAEFFRAEDFKFQGIVSNTDRDVYANTRTRYMFNHDFPFGCDFEKVLPKVAARYRKRRDRLFAVIRHSKNVLAVRMDIPGGDLPTDLDDCRYARAKLNERFAPTRFDVLLVTYNPTIPFERRTFREIEPGLFQMSFDFLDRKSWLPLQPNKKLTGIALAERFFVRDYRTAEEKRNFARLHWRERLARWKETTLRLFNRIVYCRANLILDILARRRQRKFEQFVILGFNCEPAFRFYCRWGFLDSSLFAWASTTEIRTLVRAIDGLKDVGTGEFTFKAQSRMWRCENSKISFHGRLKPRPDAPPPTEAEMTADREELRSRIAHLKEKFATYATNEKSTLFVYRPQKADFNSPGLGERLDALEAALSRFGARNWKLLVICERPLLGKMPAGPNRIFRAVNAFNPTTDVTNRRLGDSAGWNRIFTEFAPMHLLQKTHDYKFEAD